MAAFATVEDLATHMQVLTPLAGGGVGFNELETATATQALEIASGIIRAFTRQTIEAVAGDVVLLNGRGSYLLRFPERPVTAVATVKVATVAVTDFTWSEGWLERTRGIWPLGRRNIEVNYDHGYATIPDLIKGVCLELAAEMMSKPVSGLQSKSIEDASWTYSEGGSVNLKDDQKATLAPYSRFVIA